jgi:RNA polymerase sigma-70 factor (ECF subfamily)
MDGDASGPRPGDQFGDWVAPHLVDLWRFAVSLSSPDDADDLVQDTLTRAWRKREQYDPARGSARAWLLAILADRARRRWRTRPAATCLADPVAGMGEPDPARVDLRRAVDRLPPRQRLAVTLHYYLDLNVAETAQIMGCAPGTVKSTLHDARDNLARRLEASYAHPR